MPKRLLRIGIISILLIISSFGIGGFNNVTAQTTDFVAGKASTSTDRCPTDSDKANCVTCLRGGGSWTGIGCLNTSSASGIVVTLIRISLGIMGGIFLLLLMSAGYLYQTGTTENLEKAKQRILSIMGSLVFLVFSVLILRVIGVNILDVTTSGVLGG